jgi:hypothetical protein
MGQDAPERDVALVLALTDLRVWLSLKERLPEADLQDRLLQLIASSLGGSATDS